MSRLGPTEYTPTGIAIVEFLLAGQQEFLGRKGFGNFELLATGDATDLLKGVRVGTRVSVRGSLWQRRYRGRRGQNVSEMKVVISDIKKVEAK